MTSNKVTLRGELPGDEDAIEFVVCRAFGSMHEAHLVRMLRDTYSGFDPHLIHENWALAKPDDFGLVP